MMKARKLTPGSCSILVKRVVEAVEQGPQRVKGHGTVPGLDENLRRHSRNDLDPVGFGDAGSCTRILAA